MTALARLRASFCLLSLSSVVAMTSAAQAADETIAAGAYIINMAPATQTQDNQLKPYGLVRELVVVDQIPVLWAIKTTKVKDGIDFTVGGIDYKSSAFIVTADYASAAAATITTWTRTCTSQTRPKCGAVVSALTTTSFTAPVYKRITAFPNVVINIENAPIVERYLAAAGIPSDCSGSPVNPDTCGYSQAYPDALDSCDDAYSMPHSTPTWDLHQKLKEYVEGGGYLWAACLAPNELENIDSPDNGSDPDMNFLSNRMFQPDDTVDPVAPYTYDPAFAAHPIMQFLGDMDKAASFGAERVYLPTQAGWRSTTQVPAYDPNHSDLGTGNNESPGRAATVVFGPAYGNAANGIVMYSGGHDYLQDGTAGFPYNVNQVSIQGVRSYLNFLLLAAVDKGLLVTTTIPNPIFSAGTYDVSAVAERGSGPGTYTYQWSSSCGGSFAGAGADTEFTAPAVSVDTPCIVQVTVTDNCSRVGFSSDSVVVASRKPVAFDASLNVAEDAAATPLAITIPVDPDGDANDLTVLVTGLPNGAEGTIKKADGTPVTNGMTITIDELLDLTFTPAANYSGTVADFTYTVTDPTSLSDSAKVTFTITPANDPPTATDKALTVLENAGATAIGIAAPGDVDGTPSQLVVTVTGLPTGSQGTVKTAGGATVTNGMTLTPAALTALTFTPAAGYTGSVNDFTYTVTEPGQGGLSTTAKATFTITPVNDPPTASDKALTVLEDAAATAIGITAPVDPDGTSSALVVTVTALPSGSQGIIAKTADGATVTNGMTLTPAELTALTFTPTSNYSGSVSDFTFTVTEPGQGGLSTSAKATFTITPANDPPTASDKALTVLEDAAATAIGITAPVDPDGTSSALVVTVTGLPSGSQGIIAKADSTPVTNGMTLTPAELTALTFTPTSNYSGSVSDFTFTVTEPGQGGLSTSAKATFTITPVNDPPTASDKALTVLEDAAATAIGITAPADVDGNPSLLVVTVTGLPSGSQGTIAKADSTPVTNGMTLTPAELTALTFTPISNYSGSVSDFTYTVTEPGQGGLSTSAKATFTITPANDPPTASDKALTVLEDAAATAIGITAPADVDGNPSLLVVTVTALPSGTEGTLKKADGTVVTNAMTLTPAELTALTFTPTANYSGSVSDFTYTVTEPGQGGLSTTAKATFTITPVNDPPTASDKALTVLEDAAATAIGITAPADVDGNPSLLVVTVTGLPSGSEGTRQDGRRHDRDQRDDAHPGRADGAHVHADGELLGQRRRLHLFGDRAGPGWTVDDRQGDLHDHPGQ